METTSARDSYHYGNIAPLPPGDVEARLEMSRAVLRHRLEQARDRAQASIWDHINDVTGQVVPVARQYVRQKPVVSLAAAVLAGVFIMRFKPWRALGGPLLLGMLARQALAITVSRGGHILESLLAGTSKYKKSRFSE